MDAEQEEPEKDIYAVSPREHLKDLIHYDPETGEFRWRNRPLHHFKDASYQKRWNKMFAGQPAGCVHNFGYLTIQIGDKRWLGHRLAWYLHHATKPRRIYHVNGDPMDNRLCNLALQHPRAKTK
jgi:hypothetical protein